jgi:hypothetical protein
MVPSTVIIPEFLRCLRDGLDRSPENGDVCRLSLLSLLSLLRQMATDTGVV